MNMSLLRKIGVTSAVAVATIGIGVGPAMAAPISVSLGGPTTPQPFKAASGAVTLTAGVAMSCTSAGATGTLSPGAFNTDATIGTITGTTWNSCTALGLSSTVTQNGVWDIVATGAPVSGVTPAKIANVNATVKVGGICTLTVTGDALGNFNNTTQKLTLTGSSTLAVAKTGLCVGVTSPGSFAAAYNVTDTGGTAFPVTIS